MNRKRVVILVPVTVAAVVVLVIGVRAIDSYLDPFDDQQFDPAAWAAAGDREYDRGPMARDAARHLPPGTPAARVREMLGETDSVPAGGDRWGVRPRGAMTWAYYLGGWSAIGPYGFDTAFLYVHFGADGRVVTTEITGG